MDQHESRGRSSSATSPAAGQPQPHIRNSHSPSPAAFHDPSEGSSSTVGLGIGLEAPAQQFSVQSDFSTFDPSGGNQFLSAHSSAFSHPTIPNSASSFDINQGFTQQLEGEDPSFASQPQGAYPQTLLGPGIGDADFTIFPASSGEQFNTPLFVSDNQQQQQLGTPSDNMLSSPPQPHHSPTPPHLLKPEPPSANHSPSFNQHQFSSSPGAHSRNVSLGPEAALMPGQIDWSQPPPQFQGRFQGHRRSPSEYSDVSSVAPSPHLVSSDTFDPVDQSHSPLQRPQDIGLYNELHGISNFSISDHGAHSPSQPIGRSPSHSPAISPRIQPQELPEMNQQQNYFLPPQDPSSFGPSGPYGMSTGEAFPSLSQHTGPEVQAPMISIDYAPPAVKNAFDQSKSIDADSLTPPERGRVRARPRAVTDPYNSGGALLSNRSPSASGSLSPNVGSEARSDSSRSLSPLSRSGPGSLATSPTRRRQSTSSVPNNVIALRLVDQEHAGPGTPGDSGPGGAKRVQKHPATFQCTLCPKRFTRAYNLRSHLRTHTDERPFVCTVCGKAFARQHDRKRHEGLHSGEKKFVCKGDLQSGGQWGCGRRFARADALGRHFRSEAGRICIKPLLDEESVEKHRMLNEHRMQQAAAQGMVMQPPGIMMPGMDPNSGGVYPVDNGLPQALLAQYPVLATMNWGAADISGGGSGIEDELSGRSSFDASDYEEGEDGGYVSGPGTGFGPGGMAENYGEMGYTSDFGSR